MVLYTAVSSNIGQPHRESGELKMRKKFIGTVLSLALAVSAISFMGKSVPAQAAGQDDIALAASHNHVFVHPISKSAAYCVEANSEYHYVYEDITYKCEFCDTTAVAQEQTGYEKHDLRAASSPYRFECSQCDYHE